MIDLISQYGIMVLGPAAVWVVGWGGKHRRWGYIIGLVCQPFWFITLYENKQWPVFAVSFLYAFSWANGVYNHWIKPVRTEGR
jgi:hypothetical protein